VCGVVGTRRISEKWDKRIYNRSHRRSSKIALSQGKEVFKSIKELSDTWSMNKDGKMRFDPVKYSKLMRK